MALPSSSLRSQALELLGNRATPPRSELSSATEGRASANFFATVDSHTVVSTTGAKRATAGGGNTTAPVWQGAERACNVGAVAPRGQASAQV